MQLGVKVITEDEFLRRNNREGPPPYPGTAVNEIDTVNCVYICLILPRRSLCLPLETLSSVPVNPVDIVLPPRSSSADHTLPIHLPFVDWHDSW